MGKIGIFQAGAQNLETGRVFVRKQVKTIRMRVEASNRISFIRNLRKESTLRGLPVLMLTTESQDSKKQEGKTAGATGWLVKPFQPEKLLATIARVLP